MFNVKITLNDGRTIEIQDGNSTPSVSEASKVLLACRKPRSKSGKSCIVCGNVLPPQAHKGNKFCSKDCRKKHLRKLAKKYYRNRMKKQEMETPTETIS